MTLAVVATTKHPPQLVQKDYYALDINYQAHLEKKQRAASLSVLPKVHFDAATQSIEVDLPEGMTAQKGTVKCYRSATTRDDLLLPFEQTTRVRVPADKFAAGRWHVELDWEDTRGDAYFWQTELTL
jgi:hypothetical protein